MPNWIPAVFIGERDEAGNTELAGCRTGASAGEIAAGKDKAPLPVVFVGTVGVADDVGHVLLALTPAAADAFALELIRTAEFVRNQTASGPAYAAPVLPANRGET